METTEKPAWATKIPQVRVPHVPLWWRKITPRNLAALQKARQEGTPSPSFQPGQENAYNQLVAPPAKPDPTAAAGRVGVLQRLDRKLTAILRLASPQPPRFMKTPVRVSFDGKGVVFWVRNPVLQRSDILEMRFSLSPDLPLPLHCCCRVARVDEDPHTGLMRVDCLFETVFIPSPKKNPPKQPVKPVQKPAVKPAPVASPPASPAQPIPSKPTPPPPLVEKKPPPPPEPSPAASLRPPLPELPTLGKSEPDRFDKMLEEGIGIFTAKLEELPKRVDKLAPDSRGAGASRKDFRINDRIPFLWSVVSQDSYEKEVLPVFSQNHFFGMRNKIKRQQRLLILFDDEVEKLKRRRSRARRQVVWFRERCSWLFLRATSENEEDYYQGLTALFLSIAQDLAARRGGADKEAIQILAHLKEQSEIQQIRDLANPIVGAEVLARAQINLADLDRQTSSMLEKMAEQDPALAGKLTLFKEGLGAVDLSLLDEPVGTSPDGKDLYTVNLSATGIAFRTRKLWVKKGDLLEMRIFLSTGGVRFDPVNCYGKVVFTQGPLDKKLKVATYIDPQPKAFKQKVFAHVARRQREQLADRRAGKEEEYEDVAD